MPNLKKLQSIPVIQSVQEIKLKDVVSHYKEEKHVKIAEANSEEIFAYKIRYMSQGHEVVGYITEPRKGKDLPCIIWNRGGSHEFGAIKDENVFLGRLARFAKEGYLVLASQYSGNDGGEGKDEFGGSDIEDVISLHQIIAQYNRADAGRIGMCGGSRGGMMTYLALAKTNWIKAAVTEFAVSDLLDKDKHRPDFQKHLKKMFGGSKEEKIKRSAIYWADKFPKNVPLLIMHGTSDWRVNPLDSIRLAEKLQKNKVPYRLVMYEGAGHGLTEFRKEVTEEQIKWFNRYVKNREKLPNLELHGE